MTRNRLSFNVDAKGVNRDHLYAHLNSCTVPPQGILIMDSLEVAVNCYNMLKSRGITEPLVILREWSSQEGREWWYKTPADLVRYWQGQGHPEIIRYDVNEPSTENAHTLSRLLDWCCEVMEVAAVARIRVASGNFGTGRWQPEDIGAGIYDKWLQTLNRYRSLHFAALHRYAFALIFAGEGFMRDEDLLDPVRWQDENWPWPEAFHDKRIFHNEKWVFPPYWWMQRYRWFNIRAIELGFAPVPMLFTEYGFDDLPDFDRPPYVKATLNAQYKMAEYPNLRGPRSLAKLWCDSTTGRWRNKSFARALYDQLVWDNDASADNVLLNCIFAMGHWEHFGFDLERNPEFLRLLEQQPITYSIESPEPPPPPIPIPDPDPPPVTIPPSPESAVTALIVLMAIVALVVLARIAS